MYVLQNYNVKTVATQIQKIVRRVDVLMAGEANCVKPLQQDLMVNTSNYAVMIVVTLQRVIASNRQYTT